jgi:predicted MPP superfamily phosphohydrolase/tetratricopeptide (TPR) repeat protein
MATDPGHMPTWLHLSDLHLCASKTGWDADRILKFLLEDLRTLERDQRLTPDLLLVSGDLAFGHLGDGGLSIQAQFEEVALFLEEVRNACKRPIPAENVFLVPGNHDVVRGKVLPSQTKYLDDLAAGDYAQSSRAINQLLRDADKEWPVLMQRLDAYRAFLAEHYPHLLQDEKRLCYAHTRTLGGVRIGIAGLNSAWSCGRDQEKGRLWLGGQWQLRTLKKQLEGAELTLALAHHPFTWLVAQENPSLDPELQQSFDLFLHGHEHQAWVEEKPNHVRLAAGACYGETPAESGYSLVRLAPAEGRGEVWLRRFSDEGLGWIPRVIPGRTNNDGLWPLDLAWLKPAPSVAEPPPAITPDPPPPEAEATPEPVTPAPDGPESRGVYGRSREIARLAEQLAATPILLLHGMAGIGKSRLIEELHRARPGGVEYRLVQVRATPHLSADELFQQLAAVLPCFDDDPKAPRDWVKRLDIARLTDYRATARPCILHIYRLHTALRESGFIDPEVPQFLRGLVKHLPQLRIILESTKAAPEGLFTAGECTVHRTRGVDAEAVAAFFQRPAADRPVGWTLDAEQAKEVYERLGGKNPKVGAHPLGMSLLAGVAAGLASDPLQVLQRHPARLYHELEKSLFNDLYDQVLTPPQRHMLRLCALYRQSIPYQHEGALDQRVGEPGAFDALVQRFMLSPDERQERYDLHSLFAELALQRIRAGSEEYQADHAVIGEEWLRPVRGVSRGKLPHLLAANEAAHHLLEAQAFARLRELSHTLLGRDTPAALEAWSDRLHELGDIENRRHVLELLVALQPDDPKARRFLGECIEKLDGRGSSIALGHYLRAHELSPTVPHNLANIGRCLLARQEADRFVTLVDGLSDYVRERAVNAHVHDIYSRCLEQMGDGEKASRHRQEQIRKGQADAPIYNDEALYQRERKRYPEALAVLDQAERAGVMNDYLWAVKAGVLQDAKRGDEASRLRQARIHAGSRDAVFYNDEAIYRRDQGDYEGALAVLELAERNGCADDFMPNTRRSIERLIPQAQAAHHSHEHPDEGGQGLGEGPHTILWLAANPFRDLPLDEEVRTIRDGLQRARERDRFRFEHHPATRPEDWRRALLDHRPAIVQFSGHGRQNEGILLQGADGQPQPASAAALGGLFALFRGKIACVVLNTCYSEPQARAIAEHVPYVVGMTDDIADEAAREFSTAFYDALGAGEGFDFAFRLGCNALDFRGLSAEKVMVLFRDGEAVAA